MSGVTRSAGGGWPQRGLRIAAAVGLVLGLAVTAVLGQSDKYKPGDAVEVNWGGGWQPGKVLEISRNGWIKVEVQLHSMRVTPTLPPDRIRPAAAAAKPAPKLPPEAAPPRTWTDNTGKFSIEATLEDVKDGQVTLKRTDGRKVTLPSERLSQADQDFLKDLQKAAAETNPFEPEQPAAEASPFKPEQPTAAPAKPAPAGPALTAGDWSPVQTITPGQPAPNWAWTPDPEPKPVGLTTQPIPLRGRQGRAFESPRSVVISASQGRAVIGHIDGMPGHATATRFEWCDLTKGRAVGSQTMPIHAVPLGLSPDGQRLVTRIDGFLHGTKARLDVWAWTEEKLAHVVGWTPSASQEQFERDIVFADWTDDEHVVAVNLKGKLTRWKLDPLQAVYSIQVLPNSRPAVSPGGKYLAVMSAGGLEFYRAHDGQLVGRLTDAAADGSSLYFRSDGAQLAVLCGRQLMVWDLTQGKLLRDIAVPEVPLIQHSDAVRWLADNYILLAGTRLIDIERRTVLWEYSYEDARAAEATAALGGYLWFVATDAGSQSQRLVPCRLPHDEAVAAVAGLDAESLLAVKPGVSVSLDIQLDATEEQRDTIRQSLTAKLEQNGMKVAPGQPIQLVARVVQGATKEIQYRAFGVPPWRGGSKVTYTEHRCELAFLVDDQVAWQAANVASAPHMLHLNEGQTIEQAVKAATQPKLNFFVQTKLPGYLVRPTGRTSYGQSKLTPSGPVRVVPPGKPPAKPREKPTGRIA
jgi:hypothetical protein